MKLTALIAAVLGTTGLMPHIGRSEPSENQQRRRAAWLADAPRRNALALEIAEWNKNVKRRNQRFVARQLARGRSAA